MTTKDKLKRIALIEESQNAHSAANRPRQYNSLPELWASEDMKALFKQDATGVKSTDSSATEVMQ